MILSLQLWITHEDAQAARCGGRALTLPTGTIADAASLV